MLTADVKMFASVTKHSTALFSYGARVQGVTVPREKHRDLLSVNLAKTRLIICKQTAKISLEKCSKVKEEFHQPKGKGGRCQILQKREN